MRPSVLKTLRAVTRTLQQRRLEARVRITGCHVFGLDARDDDSVAFCKRSRLVVQSLS